jgi:hypothetical protein
MLIPKEKIKLDIIEHMNITPKVHIKTILEANLIPKEILLSGSNNQSKKPIPYSDFQKEQELSKGIKKPGEALPVEKTHYFGIPKQISKDIIPHAHLVSLKTDKAVCADRVKIIEEISMIDIKDEYGGIYELCKNCLKFYNR